MSGVTGRSSAIDIPTNNRVLHRLLAPAPVVARQPSALIQIEPDALLMEHTSRTSDGLPVQEPSNSPSISASFSGPGPTWFPRTSTWSDSNKATRPWHSHIAVAIDQRVASPGHRLALILLDLDPGARRHLLFRKGNFEDTI